MTTRTLQLIETARASCRLPLGDVLESALEWLNRLWWQQVEAAGRYVELTLAF